jgi:hypothetical protein
MKKKLLFFFRSLSLSVFGGEQISSTSSLPGTLPFFDPFSSINGIKFDRTKRPIHSFSSYKLRSYKRRVPIGTVTK